MLVYHCAAPLEIPYEVLSKQCEMLLYGAMAALLIT